MPIMKKFSLILIPFGIVLLINQNPALAQQSNRWQFIGRNDNGSRSYLEKSNKSETGDRKQTWSKEVYSDGSYKITLIDWQCRERRFRILEATNYAPSGEYVDKEGSYPWSTVVPDSVSENYYKVVCISPGKTPTTESNASRRKTIAQIIAPNANIRESPTANGRVVQTVEKGAQLFLTDADPKGSWYQVFIPDTNETGWLHGNTIKLVGIKSNSIKSKRAGKRKVSKLD